MVLRFHVSTLAYPYSWRAISSGNSRLPIFSLERRQRIFLTTKTDCKKTFNICKVGIVSVFDPFLSPCNEKPTFPISVVQYSFKIVEPHKFEKKLQLQFFTFPKLCKPISYMFISFLYSFTVSPFGPRSPTGPWFPGSPCGVLRKLY